MYDKIYQMPRPTVKERLKRYYSVGPAAGIVMTFMVILDIILYLIIAYFFPEDEIEKAIDFPYQQYAQNREKFGNHNFSVFD